jgi:hypothetical protein
MESGDIRERGHINALGHFRCGTALEAVEVLAVLVDFQVDVTLASYAGFENDQSSSPRSVRKAQ